MSREVCGRELVPPVAADPGRGVSVQSPADRPGRVDGSERHVLSDNVNRHLQVTVIAHDDGSVHGAAQDVDEHVVCDVDVAPSLHAARREAMKVAWATSDPLGVSEP